MDAVRADHHVHADSLAIVERNDSLLRGLLEADAPMPGMNDFRR